jgi:hypothetical protein
MHDRERLAGKRKFGIRKPVMPREKAAVGSIMRHRGPSRKAEGPPVKKRV